MPRHLLSALALVLSLAVAPLAAQILPARLDTAGTDSTSRTIALKVDSLLRSDLFNRSTVGLYIYDLTAGRPLVRCGERLTLRPASCQKLVTAIAALSILGTDYRYETALYVDGTPDSLGRLRGNLCLRAGYDPLLTADHLRQWVDSLKAGGISHVEGRLTVDLGFKDNKQWGEGWCWDDEEQPLTPLPYADGDSLIRAFNALLLEAGLIAAPLPVSEAPVPGGARRTAVTRRGIDEVLLPMMKDSHNNAAESLFYQIPSQRPATARSAAKRIDRLIASLGLAPAHYRIADGSGLSLYNYLSPELLVALLRHAYASPAVYRHLLPALPVAATDGTLRKRMHHTAAAGNVQAKTGTVTGVSTLSGYCTAANGHRLCFSIMNSGLRKISTGRDFQDAVCEAMTAAH